MIEIRVSEQKLAAVAEALRNVPKGLPRAVTRALNKTAVRTRAEVVRRVARETGLQQFLIRRSVRLARASFRRWVAFVRIWPKRLPLILFHARQTRRGVTFRLPGARGSGAEVRKSAEHAFIATMPTGYRGIYVRRLAGARRVGRLPIDQLYGPSVMEVYEGVPELAQAIQAETAARLEEELDAQVDVLLKQAAEKAIQEGAAAARAERSVAQGTTDIGTAGDVYAYMGRLEANLARLGAQGRAA